MLLNKHFFEKIYEKYTKKKYLFTDPIIFPTMFRNKTDIEISSLISSSLAYGNVKQIISTLQKIFNTLKNPTQYIKNSSNKKILKEFKKLKHRFTDGIEIAELLIKLKDIYKNNKDFESLFLKFYIKGNPIHLSYTPFIINIFGNKFKTLIPDPQKNSAMKRFNMFLRWMVRKDEIDFGIWENILKSDLIYPLDTHIHKFAIKNNITKRKDNSIKTALEITYFFKNINKDDPVKYDFALSRIGILERFK